MFGQYFVFFVMNNIDPTYITNIFVVVVLYCVQLLSEEMCISLFQFFFMSNIDPK